MTTANDLNIQQAGVVTFDGVATFFGRTLTAGTGISISNGNGVAGDPVISVTSGTVTIQTITGNTGGAQSPLAGNFNILGTGSITVVGTANTETVQLTGLTNHAVQVGAGTATLTQLAVGTTGQVLTGVTGSDPIWASPAASAIILTGNTGGALGPSNNFNIVTANTTVTFAGSGSTLTEDFGLGNLVLGTDLPALTFGTKNVGLGFQVFNALTVGSGNTAIGYQNSIALTTGSNNVSVGSQALIALTTSLQNVAVGTSSLGHLTTAVGSNTAIGYASLFNITTGSSNIAIGVSAGADYTGAESSNIIIGNTGTLGESNVIKIGTQGSTTGKQNLCFIAGITGATPTSGNTPQVVLCDNLGNLTPISSSTSGYVLTSNGTATPSFQAAGGGGGITEYFSTYLGSPTGNVTGDGTLYGPILFNGIITNSSSSYNAGTGIYTAPSTGQYCFQHTVCMVGGDALTSNYVTVWWGSAFSARSFQLVPQPQTGANNTTLSACMFIQMGAGDTMSIYINVGGTNKNILIYGAAPSPGTATATSLFSGFKVA